MTLDGLAGKVAMVTGTARGVGLAISEALAANGVRVAMLDNRQQELEQAARGVPDAATFLADVTDRTGVESVVAEIERRLGPLHALVANAGVISWKTFAEGSEADWDRAMAVNAKAVYLCCRAVYDGMKARRQGCIITLTSSAGKKATPACPHYAASKAAVLNLTLSLAADLAPYQVRVNGVAPALIDTQMFAGKNVAQLSALGRLGKPSEVGEAVAFLCSDNASFITGEILDVNGGFLMD